MDELTKYQEAAAKYAAAEFQLDAANASGLQGVRAMSDTANPLVSQFRQYANAHLDMIKADAEKQREMTNTTLTNLLYNTESKSTQQNGIDTSEIANMFNTEAATTEGELGAIEGEMLEGKRLLNL